MLKSAELSSVKVIPDYEKLLTERLQRGRRAKYFRFFNVEKVKSLLPE